MKLKLAIALLVSIAPSISFADCATEHEICEQACYVKHFNDDAAIAGCKTKCVGERGVCLAKAGADKTVEIGEGAWEGTKSFIKGVTGE